MVILDRYDEVNNVIQRDLLHGCIPWTIEWMVRYKHHITGNWKIPVSSLGTFQDDYNLHVLTNGNTENSFSNILKEIRKIHRNVGLIRRTSFGQGDGERKFRFIEGQLGNDNPCIIPVKYSPQSTHIMPVVEMNPTLVKFIWEIKANRQLVIWEMPKDCLIEMHDMSLSGQEVVILR